MYGEPITITITGNIKKAYYYYCYFPDYYYHYFYYFHITITFIITVEPKKHTTSSVTGCLCTEQHDTDKFEFGSLFAVLPT